MYKSISSLRMLLASSTGMYIRIYGLLFLALVSNALSKLANYFIPLDIRILHSG